jgi:MFS transporter, MHS family, proline/betaine transporter
MTTPPTCYFISMRSPRERGTEHNAHSETPVLPPHSLAVAAFSTIVEWYDFTLYLYFATVLARVFYGGGSGSLLLTLGGFAIAYLMRPLGALFFSHIGDKRGRRRMMLMSVGLMTAAMLVTALLPTRAAVGSAAGWLLLLLRCVMGFSVGGEYTGVVAYLLEGAKPARRGLITSSASAASEVGALLAVAISAATVSALGEADLASWGWRIPFLAGAALAGSVWIARSTMHESPEFRRQQEQGTVPEVPLRHAIANHRVGIARGFSISALGSITYYVGITYVPAFLTSVGKLSERQSLWLSTVAAIAVIAVTPLTGALSDRIGRRPVLLALCIASAALPITMFSLMASSAPRDALAGAVILACLAGAVSAVGAVATAEQLPGEGRITGLALGATMATAIFGGLTPYAAQLLVERTGWATAPGIMIAVVALAVTPVFLTMRETAPNARPSPSASS